MTKGCLLLLLLAWPAVADEAAELIKRANDLEARAEKLLDADRRAQAIDLLAQASDLRAKARALKRDPDRVDTRKKPKAKAAKGTPKAGKARHAAKQALKRLEDAAMAGNPEASRAAAKETFQSLQRWSRDLERREKRLLKKGGSVSKRLAELERQVKELRKMVGLRD